MRDFDYSAPTSVAEAVRLLNQSPGAGRPLAGGTDLIDQLRLGRHQPELVVDIKRIPELNVLELSSRGLRLGAAVPCSRIYSDAGIAQEYAALVDSARIIGGVQIQNRASVGGNLCNSGPAADSTPSLIALGARAVIAGPQGTREVPVEEFCTGPGKNVLHRGEVLVELRFPPRPANSGSHYRRFIPRNEMDIAVVSVGALVELDASGERIKSARIALGAVGPTPLFAREASSGLAGRSPTVETLTEAAQAAQAIATPIDDMRGTKEFRRHVTGVLVRRVLEECVQRARHPA
ncbi:MAG: FAD binding domain-containing protein [Planctomycetaceae bacterium]|jgi:carbon-monoxide dehydrogenase medium subunit